MAGDVGLDPQRVTTWATLQDAVGANGDGTLININGYGALLITVTGSGGATVNFEVNPNSDGTAAWTTVRGIRKADGNVAVTTTTFGESWLILCEGFDQFRARVSGWSSGTVTVKAKPLGGIHTVDIGDIQVTASATVNQGTPGAYDAPWPVALSNGATIIGTSVIPVFVQGNVSGVVTGTVSASVAGMFQVSNAASTMATATNSIVAKAAAGTLFGFTVWSAASVTQYIHVYDASGIPANGATPNVPPFPISASQNLSVGFGPNGRKMDKGIVIGNSTTPVSKTLGASDCVFDVQFI